MITMERAEGAVEIDICEAEAVLSSVRRMERAEGAVEIDIFKAEAVLSSVRRKLKAVRNEPMAADVINIFRVPAHVRRNNKHLHEPLMVAIGPYGRREKPSLRAMEHHKLRYLQDFLYRRNTTIEHCVAEIKKLEPRARRCYCDPVELSAEKFAEILLFDGCFIIELLTKLCEGKDPCVWVADCSWPLVRSDLLLLENQIPLFVLEKLFEIGGTAATLPSLRELLVNFLINVRVVRLGEEIESSNEKVEGSNHLIVHLLHFLTVSCGDKDFNHLLHFYYHCYVTNPQTAPTGCTNCGTIPKYRLNLSSIFTFLYKRSGSMLHFLKKSIFTFLSYVRSKICRSNKKRLPGTIPSTTERLEAIGRSDHNQTQNQNRQTEPTGGTIYGTILKWLNPSGVFTLLLSNVRSKTCKSNKKTFPTTIPSATELLEAGVTIKKKKNQNLLSSFLDVTFCPRHGVLEIPFLSANNSTLPLFTNLVAFEQCGGCKPEEAYMSSYAAFMDCLVNKPEDEAILRQRGILESNLASDEHLAVFFNHLAEWFCFDYEKHYLAGLFRDVRKYCDSPWHKWRAKLVRDYFSNPWAILSLIAALVVLIFTFLQTFYTIFPYYHPH